MRSASAAIDAAAAGSRSGPIPSPMAALEARVAHLEELLEGLQDSVYREAQRESKRITDLEARVEPAALSAALSKNARDRGI
jgi:hypothetical protein